jgi:uncharacterized Zn finger protein
MGRKNYPLRIPIVSHGIRAQNISISARGVWWAKRWIKSLEAMRLGARFGRGRQYAYSGQVTKLEIRGPHVEAVVQGSREIPYSIQLDFNSLEGDSYERTVGIFKSEPMLSGRVLAGDMPLEIEEIFNNENVSLFPAGELPRKEGEKKRYDVTMKCSCPDWARPCKHLVSVLLLLGEEIAIHPATLLALRGLDLDEIFPEEIQGQSSEEVLKTLPIPSLNDCIPQADALIKRLGPIPMWRSSQKCITTFSNIYNRTSSVAKEAMAPSSIDLRK